jgi:hypothetical protein
MYLPERNWSGDVSVAPRVLQILNYSGLKKRKIHIQEIIFLTGVV